jgi:Transglycosylase-like domain
METCIRTRGSRAIAALAITGMIGLVLTGTPVRAQAARSRSGGRICRIDWKDGRHQVKRLIRCAARRWHVPGGPHKALSVARCESGYNPSAYNPAGYLGVFQQARAYWPGRADRYDFDGRSAFNGRANVIVSVRMAHAGGWGPWGCA